MLFFQSPHKTKNKPIGQVLIYPWMGGNYFDLSSYEEKFDALGLTTKDVEFYRDLWLPTNHDELDMSHLVLSGSDFSLFPATVSFAAEHDPVRDDVVEFDKRLQKAGVNSEYYIEQGLIHGYLRARHYSDKAAASFARICAAIKGLGEAEHTKHDKKQDHYQSN